MEVSSAQCLVPGTLNLRVLEMWVIATSLTKDERKDVQNLKRAYSDPREYLTRCVEITDNFLISILWLSIQSTEGKPKEV